MFYSDDRDSVKTKIYDFKEPYKSSLANSIQQRFNISLYLRSEEFRIS